MAKDFSAGGELAIDADSIDSEFKFIGIAEFASQKAAVFDVEVKMNEFSFPGAKEQGLTIKRSDGKMKMSGLLPLDPKSGDGAVQMQMKMDVIAEVKIEQGTVRVMMDISGQADAEFREIK